MVVHLGHIGRLLWKLCSKLSTQVLYLCAVGASGNAYHRKPSVDVRDLCLSDALAHSERGKPLYLYIQICESRKLFLEVIYNEEAHRKAAVPFR